MAAIDYAWSVELCREMTASEAHEAWMMGEISDKTKFECRDTNCHAKITCVNMDKPFWKMKMREHFKLYGHHAKNCEEQRKIKEISRKDKRGVGAEAPPLEIEITFNMERLSSHKVVQQGKQSDYPTSLAVLFRRIKNVSIVPENNWKDRVYFGEAVIRRNRNGVYWINFKDEFENADRPVCCVIDQKKLENTSSKNATKRILDDILDEEQVTCFAFGKINVTQERIYINVSSVDHLGFALWNI